MFVNAATRRRTQVVSLPSFMGGINARDALTGMQPNEVIYSYNIGVKRNRVAVRDGWREYATGFASNVRTIVPVKGNVQAGTQDRLFAMAGDGIYDITNSTDAPALVMAWPAATSDSGKVTYTHFTNDNGDNYLLIADEENGLYEYDIAADTWSQMAVTGVPPEDGVFIVSHKSRIWFITKNSADAWYLEPGASSGAATKFNLGSKFRHGGNAVGLFNWTVDGGEGVDDHLVAISRAGDVVVYRGEDPSAASTWQMRGQWYIGSVPEGRNVASDFGGDLLLLSVNGIANLSLLMQGYSISDRYIYDFTGKITNIIRKHLFNTYKTYGWSIRIAPTDGSVVVTSPREGSDPYLQYVVDRETRSWTMWRDIPMVAAQTWRGDFYFATDDRRVGRMGGTLDQVARTDEQAAIQTPNPIHFSFLTSYSELGAPGHYKRAQWIRPYFIGPTAPKIETKALFDFDVSTELPAPTYGGSTAAAWDAAIWDNDVWTGTFEAYDKLIGASGYGNYVAIAMRGVGEGGESLASLQLGFEAGGQW